MRAPHFGLRIVGQRQNSARHGIPRPRYPAAQRAGVFICFEERAADLAANVASLGFDLAALIEDKKLFIDHVAIDRSEMMETGEYNLDGLFMRLDAAIDEVGAKRIVLDTIEILFASLTNQSILRAELRRLFAWIKEKGVTAIVTGERGDGMLTRNGLEEYVSDCVILLDNRVIDQIATRRLRIMKYRGSAHGTNEYPFLIDEQGFSVLPITTIGLHYTASQRHHLDRHSQAGRHVRRQRLFPGRQHAGVRQRRNRQEQHCRAFRRRRLPARRTLHLLRVRGITRPDRAQHAIDRHRPRPLAQGGHSALRSRASRQPRAGGPPQLHAQAGGRLQAPGRRARSGFQLRTGRGATDALAMLMRMVDLMKIRG